MYEKTLLAHKRFSVNMGRVKNLIELAMSKEGRLQPIGFWTYNGVNADLFRAVVVFMHAAVEDLVREHVKNPETFSFGVANDIFKRLEKSGYDPSPLEDLRKPLQQFAKRRHRIVHHGDLLDSAEDVAEWSIPDLWKLLHWMLTVTAFLYKFLEVVTERHELFSRRYARAREAMDKHVDFAREIVKLPERIKRPITEEDIPKIHGILGELENRLAEISKLIDEAGSY